MLCVRFDIEHWAKAQAKHVVKTRLV